MLSRQPPQPHETAPHGAGKRQGQAAIKVIEKAQVRSPKQIARLQREIRFLKLLHHPHIVRIYDVVETRECIYIIMEYAVGGELFDYIVANKRVKEKEARAFFRQVLSAVDYCHRNAVIHRDLKPGGPYSFLLL
jgi:serine/threonine protein kinase